MSENKENLPGLATITVEVERLGFNWELVPQWLLILLSPLPPCVVEDAPVDGSPCPWIDPGSGLRYYYCPSDGVWTSEWRDCEEKS